MSMFYRKELLEPGIFMVTHFGEHNWRDNPPYDGIEVTDESFNFRNYFYYRLQEGEWISLEPPPPSLEII